MLLPKRKWKDIPGYEGKYQVSNTGQVRSLNYGGAGKTKILKQNINRRGYCSVPLSKNGKCKKYSVHRLVAQAFIPNPNNYPVVNHKDENPANNAVWNLEYCTQQYNCNYGTRNERVSKAKKGEKNYWYGKKGKDSPNTKPVLMFTKNNEFLRRFDSVADANEYLDKPRANTNIYLCAEGISKTAYNYIWIYEKDCK